MELTGITFIAFLLGACLLYYIIPAKVRVFWLLACSVLFYLYDLTNLWLAAVLLGATVASYLAGLALGRAQKLWLRRLALALGLTVCLGSLVFFKYAPFLAQSCAQLLALCGLAVKVPVLSIAVPLGISYFTFMASGYLLDIYRGKTQPETNFLYYALFVSFFPCIVQGPIMRADKMLPQIKAAPKFDYSTFTGGAFRILLGFFKKLVIADTIGTVIDPIFKGYANYDAPVLAVASLAFAYRLYADFSAGCDIAIGAGACLGFELTENFRRPLAAATFTDLWRRWHITLTSWLRDYIYIPLGGNRKGAVRTYLNSFIVFIVSGIWHGANWCYVLWGAANGIVLAIGKATRPLRDKIEAKNPFFTNKYLRPVARVPRTAISYILFSLCMVFFTAGLYSGAVADAFGYFAQLFTAWGPQCWANTATAFTELGVDTTMLIMLAVSILGVDALEIPKMPVNRTLGKIPLPLRWPIYYALVLGILFFGAFGQSAFIYQQY